MPTGLDTFDALTRGGPLSGRVIVLAGAPGAGKTTLAVQLARRYYLAGHAVAIGAFDEDADGLLTRWGQATGLVREDLEAGEPGARRTLAEALVEPHLLIADAEETEAALEELVLRLAPLAAATERPGVLVIDSIQTAIASGTDEADSPRERIDLVVRALRRAARMHGLLVIATSEMARGYYRGGNQPATSALASGKESGAIEYGASMLVAMRSVKGEQDLVDVVVPKNRMGRTSGEDAALRLRLNRERATFSEVDLPVEDADPQTRTLRDGRDREDALALVERLRMQLPSIQIVGQSDLRGLARGSKERRMNAIAYARVHGWIAGGGRGVPFTVTDLAPMPERRTGEWGGS